MRTRRNVLIDKANANGGRDNIAVIVVEPFTNEVKNVKRGVILGERYEIISRIGSGGMADVYKAKDHKLNRMVAVKVLKPELPGG